MTQVRVALLRLSNSEAAQGEFEKGPVDAAVEDRDTHLDAPADHLLLIHLQLGGELAGRQVIGHVDLPIVESE